MTVHESFVENLRASGLLSAEDFHNLTDALDVRAVTGEQVERHLVAAGWLTEFQAEAVRERRFGGLTLGPYVILEKLGAGGMGVVYKARHRHMKRLVAVKLLPRGIERSERFVRRFQREVEAVARLCHVNVVMAFDAGEADAGHFLVLEYVDGCDLAGEVRQRGPLPVRDAVACTVQAARALEHAHRQGVVHRDVKPANLLRDAAGTVKVADFGLARLHGPDEAEDARGPLGASGILGTVDYMAPEQAVTAHQIDHRADIYGLGCTLYYLLVGRPPYEGGRALDVLRRHRDAPVPSPADSRPDVPAALDTLVRHMTAKDPNHRPQVMGEVIEILEALLTVLPCSAPVNRGGAGSPVGPTAADEQTSPTLDATPGDAALEDVEFEIGQVRQTTRAAS
jgi:serine/threonine protein kinase